jgi:hypothetical protein
MRSSASGQTQRTRTLRRPFGNVPSRLIRIGYVVLSWAALFIFIFASHSESPSQRCRYLHLSQLDSISNLNMRPYSSTSVP